MTEDYTTQDCKLSTLVRYQTGYYNEVSIINTSKSVLILVDNDNRKTEIPQTSTSAVNSDAITIYRRSGVCQSMSSEGGHVEIPGNIIKIDRFKIVANPIFVKEINCVVCTREQAASVVHPFSKVKYADALDETINNLTKSIEASPSVKFVANDPTGTFDYLYTILDNMVVSIPVQHNEADFPSVSLIKTVNGRIHCDNVDLSALLKGTCNTVNLPGKFIPFVTTSEINALESCKTFSWITPDAYRELKAKSDLDIKDAVDKLKAEHAVKLKDMDVQMTSLESEIKRLEAERDDFKFKYNSIRSDRQLTNDGYESRLSVMKAQNDYRLSNDNLMLSGYKLQTAHQESQFKLVHLAMAAALPVLAILAMKMFEKHL